MGLGRDSVRTAARLKRDKGGISGTGTRFGWDWGGTEAELRIGAGLRRNSGKVGSGLGRNCGTGAVLGAGLGRDSGGSRGLGQDRGGQE